MPVLVHLSTAKGAGGCRKHGIELARTPFDFRGVHALPAEGPYFATTTWATQACAAGGSIRGVFFRVADEDEVEVAHLSHHRRLTASGAVEFVGMQTDRREFVIFILRRIAPSDILDTKIVPIERWHPPSRALEPACECCVCRP